MKTRLQGWGEGGGGLGGGVWSGQGGEGGGGGDTNDKRPHRVNIQNNTPLTGLEMWIRACGVAVISHEFQERL